MATRSSPAPSRPSVLLDRGPRAPGGSPSRARRSTRCRSPRPRPVPLAARRRAGRRVHQPGQRARLPVQPDEPARRLPTSGSSAAIDRGMGLALYGRPGSTAADAARRRVGVDVPARGSRWRCTRWRSRSASAATSYELVTLGSTPQRLQALLAGECDATMLNAGNELVAEAAGCVAARRACADAARPTSARSLAVVGDERLEAAGRLRAPRWLGPRPTIVGGGLDRRAAAEAAAARLGPRRRAGPAVRRPARATPPRGSSPTARSTRRRCATWCDLRRRYLPPWSTARDVLAAALARRLRPRASAGERGGPPRRRLAPSGCCRLTTFVSTLDRFAMPPMLVAIAARPGRPAGPGRAPPRAPTSSSTGSRQPVWGIVSDRLGRVRTMRLTLLLAGRAHAWSSALRGSPRAGACTARPGRRLLRRGLPLDPDLRRRHRARRRCGSSAITAADGRASRSAPRSPRSAPALLADVARGGWRSWSPAPRRWCWPCCCAGCPSRTRDRPGALLEPLRAVGALADHAAGAAVRVRRGRRAARRADPAAAAVESAGADAAVAGAVTGVYGVAVLRSAPAGRPAVARTGTRRG